MVVNRDGVPQSTTTVDFHEAGASARAQLTADHAAITRAERLAVSSSPDSGA